MRRIALILSATVLCSCAPAVALGATLRFQTARPLPSACATAVDDVTARGVLSLAVDSATVASDGALWYLCQGKLLRVSTGGVVTTFQVPPDPYDTNNAHPSTQPAELGWPAPGLNGTIWLSSEYGLVCEATLARLRCIRAPAVQRTSPPSVALISPVAVASDGTAWVSEPGAGGGASLLLRVAPDLTSSEMAAPSPLTQPRFDSAGRLWFETSVAAASSVGYYTPADGFTTFAQPFGFGGVPTVGISDGTMYLMARSADDRLDYLTQVTLGGASTLLASAPAIDAPVEAPDESVWALAQSRCAGCGAGHYTPGTLYRVQPKGIVTPFRLSGRDHFTTLQHGPGGMLWSSAGGYSETHSWLVSITPDGRIIRQRAYTPAAGTSATVLTGNGSELWVIQTAPTRRRYHYALRVVRVTIG